MRKTSRIVFSSSWTRREQAEKLGEWQIMTPEARQITVNTVGATVYEVTMIGIKGINTLPINCENCLAFRYSDREGPACCNLVCLQYQNTDQIHDVLWHWSREKYPCPLILLEKD